MSKYLDESGLNYLWGNVKTLVSGKANTADLAAVATSGSYTDLLNTPKYVWCTLSEYNAMASHDANVSYMVLDYSLAGNPIKKVMLGDTLVWQSLPYDARIEYLASSGTQCIDTNVVFADNFSWEVRFSGCVRNTSIIGGRNSSQRTSCLFFYGDTTYDFTIPIAGLNGAATPFKLADLSSGIRTVKATIASNKGNVWVDGVQQYTNKSFSGTYISGVSCALFASKFGANDYREITTSKIYYFKAWQGSILVGDFIPVRVGTTGYMYDRVSGNLFGNVGTGSFSLGPDKN